MTTYGNSPTGARNLSKVIAAPIVALCSLMSGSVFAQHDSLSLDWMTGHWCTEDGGRITEELWLPPAGSTLVGLGRSRTQDNTTGFEYLRIVDQDGVQTFIAQPGGVPPTGFGRTGGGSDWVRFENPEHDFPQLIEYRREGDRLLAKVSGTGKEGREVVLRFDYSVCD